MKRYERSLKDVVRDRKRYTHWRKFLDQLKQLSPKENDMIYLYFVTEEDKDGEDGKPLLASAGRDPSDSWNMLASNRQRMTGSDQDAAQLERDMTARGYHVAKYSATPA